MNQSHGLSAIQQSSRREAYHQGEQEQRCRSRKHGHDVCAVVGRDDELWHVVVGGSRVGAKDEGMQMERARIGAEGDVVGLDGVGRRSRTMI